MIEIEELDTRSRHLANGKVWFYAVTETGAVVGCCSLQDRGTPWGWINDLFVDEQFRRQRVASRLVNRAISLAPYRLDYGSQAEGVNAGIDDDNVASIRLFESLSFRWSFSYPDESVRLYSLPFA